VHTLQELIAPLRGRDIGTINQLPFQRLVVIYEAMLGNPNEAINACTAVLTKFPGIRSFQILRSSLLAFSSDDDIEKVIQKLGPQKVYLKGVLNGSEAPELSNDLISAKQDTYDLHIWFELGLAYQKIGKQDLASEALFRSAGLSNASDFK
jgi:hypothetical protein